MSYTGVSCINIYIEYNFTHHVSVGATNSCATD